LLGVLDPLQMELEEDVGEVRMGTRSAPVSERGGGGTGFRRNWAGTAAGLQACKSNCGQSGDVFMREKGSGERGGEEGFICEVSWRGG
jgi:hypothetical protein